MTDDSHFINFDPITKAVVISAGPSAVWAALTNPLLMKQWISQTEIEILTDWQVGHPFLIRGPWYKIRFENRGTVLQYVHERTLQYSHLSSLSRLADKPEHYTIITFTLATKDDETTLTLEVSNFPTEAIYRHLAFYWNVAIGLLKRFVEGGLQNDHKNKLI